MSKPIIGIPMGDPAGIGPEIVVKALKEKKIYEVCNPVVIGSKDSILKALSVCGLKTELTILSDIFDGNPSPDTLYLIDDETVNTGEIEYGKVQALAGKAAYSYIKKSIDLALVGKINAVATTPINKESLKAAGVDYVGHTEIFAGLTGTYDPLTMFEVGNLRVFFLSRHVSLRKACDMVTKERVLDYIIRSSKALRMLGLTDGTVAVAGLNPHCGENGLFGDEEREIEKAVEEATKMGYKVEGPIGADSVFYLAYKGKYDAVLSLYHDQGHIATKTLDFERTISITIGLPFLRTSVDHGTAFDIAGTGRASHISMLEAILTAAKYSNNYKNR
ncbi:4-hydroxythreonine-4-phosphate dehydrogenase PdxA [Acetivibrio clariflavus]|uniref:4-hydroxythreonine-4-phosphate dehydrogenase n=1 Tax=Acetivibrio clariflavus (strain DSM 19732 / NBRC 101661 / EBR45) TaxID=720554 RepID=G8M1K4_ACECE|nr:4-hydroxythreonine-4-phosphate dehydrogenase PdxA [Acetivibrio clariflavus]AEV69219.1 4-hydroxythreonine-4-phosphate dehydrogenase [Acetivibrio clariflavus DSM 19732]HOQ01126.1 4-hydroxythreonine-4-phosphate dehydrogenase PdxA [Acetivibrio clariflavus]HPU41412.1 4-hydroxythreonine-4-phosphate dehydrogenase PdxA [Acetivibrio clariflavus]